MRTTARSVAWQVLSNLEERQSFVNLALQQAFRSARLPDRDKALCTEIVYGTVQRQRSLDILLAPVSSRALSSLDKGVLALLRMSLYQLAYLSRVPNYAVLNEAVEICKSSRPNAAGFVNGVLRAFLRDSRPTPVRLNEAAAAADGWADAMGIVYSYPTWLVRRFEAQFGRTKAVAILEACNQSAPLTLRVNRMMAPRQAILDSLLTTYGDDVAEPSPLSEVGIRLRRGIDVERLPLYLNGAVTVQDEGAMVIAPLLGVAPGGSVVDMCAAPGTKTTHIAEIMNDTGRIVACDVHEHKLELIGRATSRLQLSSVELKACDARVLPDEAGFRDCFDAVLLDAPCSGFGVLRHRPDIRWRRTEEDIRSLTELQAELLTAAVKLVRPGGTIVYSTCTLLPEENTEVIERVLEACRDRVAWDDVTPYLPVAMRAHQRPGAVDCWLTPDLFQTDGFYMARLKRLDGGTA